MQCYVHENNPPVGTCTGCGKFICAECLTDISEKNYCKACVAELLAKKERELNTLKSIETPLPPPAAKPFPPGVAPGKPHTAPHSVPHPVPRPLPSRIKKEPYPEHCIWVHILLAVFTGGVGNVIYLIYILYKQEEWRRGNPQ